jgi:AcrR family transcriptional regulator/DNA-binding MarR family transcriptional regulator
MPSRLKPPPADTPRQGAHVGEMQRRRLLLAFADILARHGLDGAGVGSVCRQAGVSRRTFYDLFSDREHCFLATFDAAIERIARSAIPVYSPENEKSWRERLRAALAAILERFEEEPALIHVCLTESPKGGPALLARRREVLDVLTTAVDEGRLEAKDASTAAPITAESVVGGAISVIQARVLEHHPTRMLELLNPLMSMIVHPYLGAPAAKRELEHPRPRSTTKRNGLVANRHAQDPFKDLPLRVTFRTARVLTTIAAHPGASNREIMSSASVADQGQMSKLLKRLESYGLVVNQGAGQLKGESNAWRLTERGEAVQAALGLQRTAVTHSGSS